MQLPSADDRDMSRAQMLVGSCRVSQSIAVYLCLCKPLRKARARRKEEEVQVSDGVLLPAMSFYSHGRKYVIKKFGSNAHLANPCTVDGHAVAHIVGSSCGSDFAEGGHVVKGDKEGENES